ncbi:unnamed protein product [Symbiodinium natans]|uniref:Protochlorophyllide reductase n=1 Tax=Symbiodinium natans TaxID=878477 RepID=A0A812S1L6_9DINO|nr:unnamed protein product [Symbiodinium natans]
MAPDGKFVNIECDLQDFESVRRAAAEIKSKYRKLYCLSLNAGIVAMPDKATKDGFDVQMQTNHLSHFLLAAELMPLLEAEAQESGDARIVTHTSMGRLHTRNRCLEEKYFGRNGGNLGGNSTDFMGDGCFARYFQTKLANTVFTYSLHEKLKKRGSKVRSISAHPGGSQTNFADHLPHMASSVSTFQSQEDGSMGLLTAMVSLGRSSMDPLVPLLRNPYLPKES